LGGGLGGRGALCYSHCGDGGLGILWVRFDKLVVLELCKWQRETRGRKRRDARRDRPPTRFDPTIRNLRQWRNHVVLFHFLGVVK
jgi:hypothetical protein